MQDGNERPVCYSGRSTKRNVRGSTTAVGSKVP